MAKKAAIIRINCNTEDKVEWERRAGKRQGLSYLKDLWKLENTTFAVSLSSVGDTDPESKAVLGASDPTVQFMERFKLTEAEKTIAKQDLEIRRLQQAVQILKDDKRNQAEEIERFKGAARQAIGVGMSSSGNGSRATKAGAGYGKSGEYLDPDW